MSFEILDSSTLDRIKWAELVQASPHSTFFQNSCWGEVWEKSLKNCRALFFVEESGGNYSNGLPLVEIKKYKLASYFSMPMGTYGGVLSTVPDADSRTEFLRKVLRHLESPPAVRIQIVDFSNECSYVSGLGFKRKMASTQIINLKSLDLPQLLSKRGAGRAAKEGVEVKFIQTAQEVEECYGIYLQTAQRHGEKPKYSQDFYRNLFALGRNQNWLVWWLATKSGRVCGYSIKFAFKDQIYPFDSASAPGQSSLRISDLLLGQGLEWAAKNNFSGFNLGGTPESAPGVKDFKRQWGGEEKSYPVYEKVSLLGKLAGLIR
ncbi:MAG: GNAT family N-acetyltransferase [candidate division Zixibacteria bacterium]|nr:GNAT family N-acetyltransferase [candidate division Zixibacteria bacterium]